MILRAPAVPLITVDPYFSVWSDTDRLNEGTTVHWTGKPNTIVGLLTIDGKDYRFMGEKHGEPMTQTGLDITALTSEYTFEAAGVRLKAKFFTPLFPDSLAIMTRPVSYLALSTESTDGAAHTMKVKIIASEELCINLKGELEVETSTEEFDGINAVRIGSKSQPVLGRKGDDLRIDWGYFYLAAKDAKVDAKKCEECGMTVITLEKDIADEALIAFAYDDIYSIEYFGEKLKSVWNKDGKTIETAISEAFGDYEQLAEKAVELDDKLLLDSVKAGGEKYSDMLRLAFRQAIAAHKAVLDKDGELLFISKECFSNGCAATVDVSYPSIPMFLIYNPELVLGMMRPIFRFAESDAWEFDFAPHDVGTYPLVNGQVYGGNALDYQMPVEECGNMLVMTAAYSVASGDFSYAEKHFDTLVNWTRYLTDNGADPANQLCTDDFAGHLAHNCNLSLKAISGIAGMGKALEMAVAHLDERMAHEKELRDYVIDRVLKNIPEARLNGGLEHRLPGNANISFPGLEGETILLDLDMHNICASTGSACNSDSLDPSHVLLSIGVPEEIGHGSMRFTFGPQNTMEEAKYLCDVLEEVIPRRRAMSCMWLQGQNTARHFSLKGEN